MDIPLGSLRTLLRKQNEEDMKRKDDSDSEDEEGMKDGSDSEDDEEEADKKKGIKAMDTVNFKEKTAAFSVPMPASDLDLSKLSYE